MPNYLCVQRNLSQTWSESPSPSEMQEMYSKFAAWQQKFNSNIVDMGGKLGNGKLVSDGGPIDGPFVEIKELVGGYMIVQVENLEEASDVARECPGLVRAGSGGEMIEIYTG